MPWIEQRDSTWITWDAPKTVEGVYNGSEIIETRMGTTRVHTITVDGEPRRFFGTAILDKRLGPNAIGRLVRIVYTGNSISTQRGRTLKEFRVFVNEDEKALTTNGQGPVLEQSS